MAAAWPQPEMKKVPRLSNEGFDHASRSSLYFFARGFCLWLSSIGQCDPSAACAVLQIEAPTTVASVR
jgi:hypothetical protein